MAVISPDCKQNLSTGSGQILNVMKALANIGGELLATFDKLHQSTIGNTLTGCVGNLGVSHPDTAAIALQVILT